MTPIEPIEPFQLQGTLRGHNCSVTSIESFYVPTGLTYGQGTHYLNCSLLTGDADGYVVWWDLTTRRPVGRWAAHDKKNQVITIEQAGVSWKHTVDGDVPVIDDDWFGCVLTHGKDGEIKIWRLFSPVRCGQTNEGIVYQISAPLSRRFDSEPTELPPVEFEMPVNMLNFSNVTLSSSGLLAAPATQDSNNFDLYRVPKPTTGIQLKRLLKNTGPAKPLTPEEAAAAAQQSPEEVLNGPRRGEGIIMKLVWLGDKLAVGYESGKICLYSESGELVDEYSELCPDPLTAMCCRGPQLFAGSASDKLCRFEGSDSTTEHIRHKGIGDLSVATDGTVGLVGWDGYARFYDSTLKFLTKIKRQAPSIADNRDTVDTEDIKEQTNSKSERATHILFGRAQPSYSGLQASGDLQFHNGRSKNLIRHRLERSYKARWLFIGYQDGKVRLYNV